MFYSYSLLFSFVGDSRMPFVFIYVYWCPTRLPYQMMLVSCRVVRVACGAGTVDLSGAHELIPSFYWDSCCPIFSFLCNVLLIVICTLSFGHCVVCSPAIYGF